MLITDVCCRWPGSAHDATIFANSELRTKIDRGDFGTDCVLLGDSAYGSDYYVCKPLRNPTTRAEKRYQKAQLKTRNIAERTYGGIKKMLPCLKLGMRFKLNKVQDVIAAGCIVYNIAKMENLNGNEPNEDEINLQNQIGRRLIEAQRNQPENRRIKTRKFLIDHHFV